MGIPERSDSTSRDRAGSPQPGRVLVVSDNEPLVGRFVAMLDDSFANIRPLFDFVCSPSSDFLPKLDVKTEWQTLVGRYGLVISLHCKQIFPAEMVRTMRCVNVHPGLNPWNRGWYPQVFAIINKLPMGATIHEIDEQLDHGPIIDQVEIPIEEHDTSLDVYNRALEAELTLLERNLGDIVAGSYSTRPPVSEGNVNLRRDFDALRCIDREQEGTFGSFIDRLRALTHGEFRNAYFIDDRGRRVFIRLTLELEDGD